MTISSTIKDNEALLQIDGRVDTNTSPQLQSAILNAFQRSSRLVLDFAKVPYISSAGLRALLIGQKTANSKRAVMELIHVSPTVMTILQAVGLLPQTGYLFICFYLILCLVFGAMFWLIFSNATWSSRAMKTQAELNVARNIQRDMLPCIFPAFPEKEEFDVYATMEPAKEVGGDFYDFFLVDDRHLAIVISDVSGKGVPAALFMVIAKTLIKNQTQPGIPLGEVFTRVNNQLCENNGEAMFVTSFMGVLDLDTLAFTFVNAGHNPPLLMRSGQSYEFLQVKPGFVLAGLEGVRYKEETMQLSHGDRLFLYTDGVTEAINAASELYGEDRLKAALNKGAALQPEELLAAVKTSMNEFTAGAEQFDDITMLALEVH